MRVSSRWRGSSRLGAFSPIVERLVLSTEGVVAFESRLSYPPDDAALTTGYSSQASWFVPRVNR